MSKSVVLKSVSHLGRPLLIGMVHLRALPGTPAHSLPMKEIEDIAVHEAQMLASNGYDGIIVENMHDTPYARPSDTAVNCHTVAAMSSICRQITTACLSTAKHRLLFGVQMLAACNREAIAIAHANAMHFVRAEGLVFGHVADEGYIDGCAATVMRYRREIGAEGVAVITDARKKHSSHAITSDLTIHDWTHAAEFARADGVVITGKYTGDKTDHNLVQEIRSQSSLPVWVGSGVTSCNASDYFDAHALIVGSWLKVGGNWENDMDLHRVRAMRDAVRSENVSA